LPESGNGPDHDEPLAPPREAVQVSASVTDHVTVNVWSLVTAGGFVDKLMIGLGSAARTVKVVWALVAAWLGSMLEQVIRSCTDLRMSQW
jgi:hypothetical protein